MTTTAEKTEIEKKDYTKVENGINGIITDDKSKNKELYQISQLYHLYQKPIIPNRNKVLLILLEKIRSINEISNIINLEYITISNIIKRNDRQTGLFYDKLIEVKNIVNGVDYWGLTHKGELEVNNIIKKEKEKEKNIKDVEYRHKKIEEQINDYRELLENEYKSKILSNIDNLIIDFFKIAECYPENAEDLLDNPEDSLKAIQIALERITDRDIKIRINNLPKDQKINIGGIRQKHLNKLLTVEGVIKQISPVKGRISITKYECPSCGNNFSLLQLSNDLKEPKSCGCGRRGAFLLIDKTVRDCQRMVIEETGEQLKGRNQPASLNVVLYDDLTNPDFQAGFNPGKSIRINGILKDEVAHNKRGSKSVELTYFMEANYIEFDENIKDIIINDEDIKKIKELGKDPQIVNKLISNIAINIYGYDILKKALLLQLVKGSNVRREEIHIFLVGDPGLAKTILSKEFEKVIPGSRFVSGTSTSKAGLGASVIKDDFLGGWILQAGALTLSNNGLCVIDELDKIKQEDRDILHDVMELGEINVDKANIHTTLKAKVSILSTANPMKGRFDEYNELYPQIDLVDSLLSRFDVIFILIDKTSKDQDLIDFMLSEKKKEKVREIEFDLIQKYIIYARNIKPLFSDDSKKILKKRFMELRKGEEYKNITPRVGEALIRLASAHAKLRLSENINILDVEAGFDIIRNSFTNFNYS